MTELANKALAALFLALFAGIYAVEEWVWRRRTKQTMRGLMRML